MSLAEVKDETVLQGNATIPAPAAAQSETLQQSDNKFQSAISVWRNIDLTAFVPELDNVAGKIVSQQKEALIARKDVAQKTKDFRKLDDATKLVEVKALLKAYQGFVDLITEHGKTSSSTFLRVYSSLSEAPDPYPLLEASIDALLTSEDTLPKITAENEHLQRSVGDLTSQLDAVEKSLDQERTVRKQLEKSREAETAKVEASWKAVMEEKQDNWTSKERGLREKVENQERLLSELRANNEVAQRLSQGEESATNAFVNTAALELVNSDLDRTSQRLAEVEARNERLRTELAEATSSLQRAGGGHMEENPEVAQLRSENSSLLRRLNGFRLEKDSSDRKRETQLRSLEKDSQAAEHDRDMLRQKLADRQDYDEIKRELDIFKAIELTGLGGDVDVEEDEAGTTSSEKVDSLEKLLMARNKKLSNEMAIARVSHQTLQTQVDDLRAQLSERAQELAKASQLNETLEGDLVKVQEEASNMLPSSGMSIAAGTYTSRHPRATQYAGSIVRGGRTSPTSSIISGFDPRAANGVLGLQSGGLPSLEALRAGEPVGGGSGILPMIQAQRDRFKVKNGQLESELSQQQVLIGSLRQEVAVLQKDNVNLYEKSRYVSTYARHPHSGPANTTPSTSTTTSTSIINMGGDRQSAKPGVSSPLEARYRSTYEASLSPFAAFRGREHTRAYRRMSLPERVIFSIARMVLANRMSRNLFAGYCFALHFLVFFMLYWMHGVDSVGSTVAAAAAPVAVNAVTGAAAAVAAAAGGANAVTGSSATGNPHRGWMEEGFEG